MGKSNKLNFDFDEFDRYEDISSHSGKTKYESEISISQIGSKHEKKKSSKRSAKRRSSRKKKVLITLISILLVLGLLVGWFFYYWRYNYNPITEKPEELGFEKIIDKEVYNIALFGIDTRNLNSFTGNSDSIMILSLNTKLKTVKIVSILRDTIVPITNNGRTVYGKINSAYAKSPEIAIRTLNEAFGLDISEYATVNFYGMSEIIDAVGGIDATVTEDELKHHGRQHPNLNGCMDEICSHLKLDPAKYYITTPGLHHMNGVQAVAYSRIRSSRNVWGTNNDYGRTDRQRYVMEQLFSKAINLEKSKYTKLAKAMIPCTETSLSYTEIMGLAFNILLNSPTFDQARIPQDDWGMPFKWNGYGSVVYYDLDYASRAIHSLFYDNKTIEQFVEENPVEKNDWFATRKR